MTARTEFILACGVVVLFTPGVLLAQLTVINDGTTTTNLAKLSNSSGSGGAIATLATAPEGVLMAAQSTLLAELPLRTVWFPSDRFSTGGVYHVLADFKPAEPEGRNRGGVMGWLNLFSTSRKGISFQVSPSSDSTLAFFQVAVVDFTATDESANEGFTGLFNLDGTEATADASSAVADVGGYDPSKFATFQLEFSTPTADDQTALTNKATAHINAKVFQVSAAGETNQLGRTIELLTDLPLPPGSNHRFGYYAFWGSLFAEGSMIGQLDNLSISGGLGVATNSPPEVSLTSPANGAVFHVPVDIELAAEPFDQEGTVTRVDFFNGNSLISSVSNSPYSLTWSNVPPGVHSLSARASDGHSTASSTNVVRITVSNTPPAIAITSPSSDATYTSPVDLTIVAEATDDDGVVDTVDFVAGTTYLGTSTGEENVFRFTWLNAPPGTYSLAAQANDNWGATTLSTNAIQITVNPPPVTGPVSLTISRAPGTVTVSWPEGVSGFHLQSKTNLSSSVWVDMATSNNTFTMPSTNSATYFRLKNP